MASLRRWRTVDTHTGGTCHTDQRLNNDFCSGDGFSDGGDVPGSWATTLVMVTMESGGRRWPPRRWTPTTWVATALPGLANAPREAALEDRGFAVEGLAEFWAAAAAAAKVARFCNCRALIPGERSQRGWCQT